MYVWRVLRTVIKQRMQNLMHVVVRCSPKPYLLLAVLLTIYIAGIKIFGRLEWCRGKGEALKTSTEYLDVVSSTDPDKVLSGQPLPIESIHRNGLFHRGVWLFILDSRLHLLLARRASFMKTCPSTWSTLGEHVSHNESFLHAANRGLSEEVPFFVQTQLFRVGIPFSFHAVYENGTAEQRIDNQWTQAYVLISKNSSLNFNAFRATNAYTDILGENSRFQGMTLPDVIKNAMYRPSFFCNTFLSQWILRLIPSIVHVIRTNEEYIFGLHLRDRWSDLIASGAHICCNASQHRVPVEHLNIAQCGLQCTSTTYDPLDAANLRSAWAALER